MSLYEQLQQNPELKVYCPAFGESKDIKLLHRSEPEPIVVRFKDCTQEYDSDGLFISITNSPEYDITISNQ